MHLGCSLGSNYRAGCSPCSGRCVYTCMKACLWRENILAFSANYSCQPYVGSLLVQLLSKPSYLLVGLQAPGCSPIFFPYPLALFFGVSNSAILFLRLVPGGFSSFFSFYSVQSAESCFNLFLTLFFWY